MLGFNGITSKQQMEIEKFIQECIVIDINETIKREVILIRQANKLKLPDSIILATARYLSLPIITSDLDFKLTESSEIILYQQS